MRFYFRTWCISIIFLSWETFPSCFGHFVFMCSSLTFLSHMDNTSFFLVSFGGFDMGIMQICGDINGPGSWESF
jgi:hypothetical protein